MSARALGFVMAAVALLTVGCTHTLEVRSDPPGADVYVDGERMGQTPLVLEQETGQEDVKTLSVRSRGREARFAVAQSGWSPEAIAAGIAAAAATALLGGMMAGVGYVGLVAVLVTSPALGAAALPFFIGAIGLFYGGALVASFSAYAPFLVAGEWGRTGPADVFVDFGSGDVETSPPGHASPLIGVTEGFVPVAQSRRPDKKRPRAPSREDPRPE